MTTVIQGADSPTDPDCIHCYLPPLIDAWREAHPSVRLHQVVGDVANVLGELVASEVEHSGLDEAGFRKLVSQVVAHFVVCAADARHGIAKAKAEGRLNSSPGP